MRGTLTAMGVDVTSVMSVLGSFALRAYRVRFIRRPVTVLRCETLGVPVENPLADFVLILDVHHRSPAVPGRHFTVVATGVRHAARATGTMTRKTTEPLGQRRPAQRRRQLRPSHV